MLKSLLLGLIALLFGASVNETKTRVVNLKGLSSNKSVEIDAESNKDSLSVESCKPKRKKFLSKLKIRRKTRNKK